MKERKRDTRRKILAGTCVLDRAEKDADAAEVMDETSIGSSQVYSHLNYAQIHFASVAAFVKDADAAEVMDETSIGSSQVYSQ